jgi:DNA-binding NarL/FixJ family response regulator
MIKLIITDDHKLIRDGLKAMLSDGEENIQVVGEASSGRELINMLPGSEADVVLMDMSMPEMSGLEATGYIAEHFAHLKVLVLSMMEQEKYVAEAIKAGALGYILKTADQEELIHAIQTVARGEQYVSTQIAIQMLKTLTDANTLSASAVAGPRIDSIDLSKREMEVLQLIAQGYTNQQIADITFTSKRTLESHRQNLLDKTGCKNTASLIMYASKHHLLDEGKPSGAGN